MRLYTTEIGTLNHTMTFADSGLANRKAVDVRADADGVPEISLKNDSDVDQHKPDKMWKTVTLNGGARKAMARTDHMLSSYRPAAKEFAVRKVSALARADARAKSGLNHEKVKKGRTSSK